MSMEIIKALRTLIDDLERVCSMLTETNKRIDDLELKLTKHMVDIYHPHKV